MQSIAGEKFQEITQARNNKDPNRWGTKRVGMDLIGIDRVDLVNLSDWDNNENSFNLLSSYCVLDSE